MFETFSFGQKYLYSKKLQASHALWVERSHKQVLQDTRHCSIKKKSIIMYTYTEHGSDKQIRHVWRHKARGQGEGGPQNDADNDQEFPWVSVTEVSKEGGEHHVGDDEGCLQ